MRHKGQINLDHQPAPRRPAQARTLPELVREALTSRSPSPEALAARDAYFAALRTKKVGPW